MKRPRQTNPPQSPFFTGGSGVLLVLALLIAACRASSGSPQGVAEGFVDQHYVRMDLKAAQAFCVGVAWQKVEEEKRLIGDQQIDASTRKPRVTYSLKEEVPSQGDSSSFVFAGTIQVDGAGEFTRNWLVNTRKEADGAWKVSNFSEFDAVNPDVSETVPVHPGLFVVDAEQAGHLVGGMCGACARSHFPRLDTCPYCSTPGCRAHALPREGTLYLYTAVLNRPPGYRGDVPFGFGVVQLRDGLRVLTRLTEPDLGRLRPGMAMRLVLNVLHRDDAGHDVITYAFAPEQ